MVEKISISSDSKINGDGQYHLGEPENHQASSLNGSQANHGRDFLRRNSSLFARRSDLPSLHDVVQKVMEEEGYIDEESDNGLATIVDLEKQKLLYREMHIRFFAEEPMFASEPIHADDPRWKLVQIYEKVKNAETGAIKTQLQILTHTLYLDSSEKSNHKDSIQATVSGIRQLLRGLANATSSSELNEAYHTTAGKWAEITEKTPTQTGSNGGKKNKGRTGKHISEHVMTLDTTKRIGKNLGLKGTEEEVSQGITPCPEALYQLRLWEKADLETETPEMRYIGRIGFNVHYEGYNIVFSVNNLQHSPEIDRSWLSRFKKGNHGKVVTDYLLQRLQMMAGDIEAKSGRQIIIRGLANPEPQTIAHDRQRIQELGQMYQTAFAANGIQTISANNHTHEKHAKDAKQESKSAFNTSDAKLEAYIDWVENKNSQDEELYNKFVKIAALIYPGIDIDEYTAEQKQVITEIIQNIGEIKQLGGKLGDEDLLPFIEEGKFTANSFRSAVKSKRAKVQHESHENSVSAMTDGAINEEKNNISPELTPEYIQIASVIYPEADVNNLTSEQRDILHKIMTAGTEIMGQNPRISEDKLVEMINERVHIPGYRQRLQPAAAEAKEAEVIVEQKAEPAPQPKELIITDEYYLRFLKGEFPQYGELATQIFHGADVNILSPDQQQTLTSILDAAIMIRKQNPGNTEEEIQQKISAAISDILKPRSNVKNATIETDKVQDDQLHVASPSVIIQNPHPTPESRRVNKMVENKRALQRMRINRSISEQLAEDAWNVTPKAVAFQHNGQVFRNGENQVAVIPLDKNAAYAVVPDSAYRVQIEGWQDPNVVSAKLADTFPGNTSPRMWKLRSDYTGEEWKPKKKPEKPPVIMPPPEPDDSDPADIPPPPPIRPNMPPNVPGYNSPNFSGGPPLINPNRANSGQRNKTGRKNKNQAGEVAKAAAVLAGNAALVTGKFAGKMAVKATVATAKGAFKVATAERTRAIAWGVTKTTAKVAATIAFAPVIMYVASRDEKITEDGVERVHSPAYWRWRKAGKMAGRAYHETGLAYMKFGAVGGEIFGDHESNEFVDKLYLKKSREWEADDEQTRQRRAAEEKIKGSWNPVNGLGRVLNTFNPSFEDLQRGHAEGQAAWDKERRENAFNRLKNEYGPNEAKRIMADLENQGLDPKDVEKAAKQHVNDTRNAEDTEKTWRKIEKQHGKAVADALRGSGADLTDMGLIHAADDIAARQRKEQEAAEAAEREAANRAKAKAKAERLLGPDAQAFIEKLGADTPPEWINERVQAEVERRQREIDRQAWEEKQERKQQEERQRKADEQERKRQEKLQSEEEERIKAEKRKAQDAANRAAQNAENPPRQQPQQQPQRQPAPQPQPPAFVPPQPESRPAKQPDPAPQKPDQKPAQTRSSQDAKQGGGFFERIRHDDNAQEERPEKQDTKPQQPQKPSLPTSVRTPQQKPQRALEPAPLPTPKPPVSESKPQPPPIQPSEKKADEPIPPPVTVPVYQYTPPPRREDKPEQPPEPKVPEQKTQEKPPEPEPQLPEPPPEEKPEQSSAKPDAPQSEEPEVLPGIKQKYNAEPQEERIILPSDRLDQLYDLSGELAEQVSESRMAKKYGGESDDSHLEDSLEGLRVLRHKVENVSGDDEGVKSKKELILKEIDRILEEKE